MWKCWKFLAVQQDTFLSCCGCSVLPLHVLALLSRLFCPGYPALAVLFWPCIEMKHRHNDFKGTVARDFLASFFSWIYSIWASYFEAKRVFFSFSFSRSYSNISMNPRCRLLRGLQNIFLRIPKLMVKFDRYKAQLFTTWMILNLLSLLPGHQSFKVWHLNLRSSYWIPAIGYCGNCQ